MDWKQRVRTAFMGASHTPADEIIEELAQHATSMYEAEREEGCSEAEAIRRVDDQLERWRADALALKRRSRQLPSILAPPAESSSPLAGLVQDLRYAIRVAGRQPRHALLTMATMALGVGLTTSLFSVTYGVLMKPLPWPHSDRIVVLTERRGGNEPRFGAFTNAAYRAWSEQPTTIEGIAAWSQRLVTLTGAGEPERIRVISATSGLFAVLGARPLSGSFFGPRDEASPVVVLSERLWRQRFSADPAVVGRSVQLDGQSYTVMGVLPDRLAYPDRQTLAVIPYSVPPTSSDLTMFNALAALRPGVTVAQAAAEGTARGRVAGASGMPSMAIFGSNGPVAVTAQPLRDALTADVRRPLLVLLGAVGLLLVAATANVANLQLARLTTRRRELAIRAALGAGTSRLTRQIFVECLALGLISGVVGVAFTYVLHRSMPSLLPPEFPRLDALDIDTAIVSVALVVAVGTSIGIGLLPAWRMRRMSVVHALAEDGNAPVGAEWRSQTARSRMLIMSAQVAIACVLLVGASLLGRSLLGLINADRGYDLTDVLSARISMPMTMYPTPQRRFAIVEHILTRLTPTPGASGAAFTSELPLTPGGSTAAFELRSGAAGVVRAQASPRIVSPQYFATLRIRTVAGRVFTESDTETSEQVVVVNRTFASRYLGDAPLGASLPVAGYGSPDGESIDARVIGVVDDVHYVNGAEKTQPEVYYAHRQMAGRLPVQTVTLLTRAVGNSDVAAAALTGAVRDADQRLVADMVMPLEQRLLATLSRPRLYTVLLGGFAACAVALAAVGLFGLLSYAVSLRSRELALRSALGAPRVHILSLVLRQGLGVMLGGLAAGIAVSASLTSALSTQLYGVTAHDPLTFVVVPLFVFAVGSLACLMPALRAASLDPSRVLRGN